MFRYPRHALILCALFAILLFHLAVAWQDFATLARNGFLYDDSFYSFKIAQNIAAGQGPTFDGIQSTNGFQPLYTFMLVPIYLLFGRSLTLPVYVALSLLAILTLLTAWFLYKIVRRYVGRKAAYISAAIWLFSPVVIRQGANGLETALAVFMLAICAYYYLEKIRSRENPARTHFIILGAFMGLAVLARVDEIFLVLVILLDYLLVLRRRRAPSRALVGLFFAALSAFIVYSPWLIFNLVVVGSPLQDSGVATRFISLAYAPLFSEGYSNPTSGGPDLAFIWMHIVHSVSVMKVAPPVHVIFRSISKVGYLVGATGMFRIAADILGCILLVVLARIILKWRKEPQRNRRGEVHFLLMFSALLIACYCLYIFGLFFFIRYYYPIYFIACIYAAFLLQDLFDWLPRRSPFLRKAVAVGGVVYALAFAYFSFSQAFRSQPVYHFYDLAQWANSHTEADETIGAFQGGAIGYLSHRRVINLDGKVNREALEALKEGCLGDYLKREGIDLVIDHEKVIECFLQVHGGASNASCTPILRSSLAGNSGWIAFRPKYSKRAQAKSSGGGHEFPTSARPQSSAQ